VAATLNTPSASAEPVGGVPDSIPPPVLEEPDVILGWRLQTGAGPERAPPPLPRVLSRAHQALRETETAILHEWEALETEHQRLGDWCTQMEKRTKAASCHIASERAELEQEREDFKEDIRKVSVREQAVTREGEKLGQEKGTLGSKGGGRHCVP
jgi:chromosome segregation ATPase